MWHQINMWPKLYHKFYIRYKSVNGINTHNINAVPATLIVRLKFFWIKFSFSLSKELWNKNGEVVDEGLRSWEQEPVGSSYTKMESRRVHRQESPPPLPHGRRSRQALWGTEEKAHNPGIFIFFLLVWLLWKWM